MIMEAACSRKFFILFSIEGTGSRFSVGGKELPLSAETTIIG
jgi:hypothetical protein